MHYGIQTLLQQTVFASHEDGGVGKEIEILLAQQGLIINHGPGPDLPNLGIEVKTRNSDATSCITLGSLSPQDILKYQYNQTDLYLKLRDKVLLYTVRNSVIIDEEIVFFSDNAIQQKIKESYKFIQQVLEKEKALAKFQSFSLNGFTWEYQHGVMRLRVQNAKFNALKTISRQSNHFQTMFETVL